MKIAVTGSSGMVGSALLAHLGKSGQQVWRIVRRPAETEHEIVWDPMAGFSDPTQLEGLDAVVHLAGQNIAGARWTPAFKEKIRESRTEGTRVLAGALASLETPPRVLVSASAIGYYGSRGDERLKEESGAGEDFLAGVCKAWEEATAPAREAGVRVVVYRLGMILDADGGALKKMLLPFKLGVGGVMGSGQQIWSWVSTQDVVRAIVHAIQTESMAGPHNLVAPTPVTNREFTKTLGRVLGRPTVFPMPAFVARAVFGEMASALILASQLVDSSRLTGSGFEFEDDGLESCLRRLL